MLKFCLRGGIVKGIYFENMKAEFREDIPVPNIKEDETLVKILLSSVCSTDREIIKGYRPDFKGILGHEFVGIAEKSSNPNIEGKRVVGEINAGCGHCIYCKTAREKHCLNRKTIGIVNKDGCFCQYMSIRTDLLHIVPDEVSDEEAVCTEPLAAALEILQRKHIGPADRVCVIGDGRLSFMIAQVIALNGADVLVLGHHKEKLEWFKSFAEVAVSTDETFEIVVDACGHPSGLDDARRLTRCGGTIIMKSTYQKDVYSNLSWAVVDEITLMGSRCGPFKPALRLLKDKKIILPKIELFRLEDWEKALDSKAFKVGFDMRN